MSARRKRRGRERGDGRCSGEWSSRARAVRPAPDLDSNAQLSHKQPEHMKVSAWEQLRGSMRRQQEASAHSLSFRRQQRQPLLMCPRACSSEAAAGSRTTVCARQRSLQGLRWTVATALLSALLSVCSCLRRGRRRPVDPHGLLVSPAVRDERETIARCTYGWAWGRRDGGPCTGGGMLAPAALPAIAHLRCRDHAAASCPCPAHMWRWCQRHAAAAHSHLSHSSAAAARLMWLRGWTARGRLFAQSRRHAARL
jgi:hypothetical protein